MLLYGARGITNH